MKLTRKQRIPRPSYFCILFYGCLWMLIVLAHYPIHSDVIKSRNAQPIHKGSLFYEQAYAEDGAVTPDEPDDIYVQTAKKMAELFGIKEAVEKFAADYKLSQKKVLEVGAGRGYLQDVVENYTGLDISATARRYFHKPFVQASATEMPFEDNSFDAVWTIWVLEHVPNPEQALSEMRRVLRHNGVLYLAPAWRCTSWAADGYAVRQYSDLNASEKLIKATLSIRTSPLFQMIYLYPGRLLRTIEAKVRGGESVLRYTRLSPNYDKYWVPDSDAVNSIDRFEAMMWFKTRGDECLNCGDIIDQFKYFDGPLVVRIRKERGESIGMSVANRRP